MNRVPKAINLADGSMTGLLTTAEAAYYLGFTARMLQARRIKGDGPQFVQISKRAIRYRLEDLDAWIVTRLKTSTTAQ